MAKFTDFIFLFNLFPYKMNFNIKGKTGHNTIFSLLISLTIIFMEVLLAYYFSKDFINHTNPIVIFKEKQFTDTKIAKLSDFIKSAYFKFEVRFKKSKIKFDVKKYFNSRNYTANNILKMRILVTNSKEIIKEGHKTREPIENVQIFSVDEPFEYKFYENYPDSIRIKPYIDNTTRFNVENREYYYDELKLIGKNFTTYNNVTMKDIDIPINKQTSIYILYYLNDNNDGIEYYIESYINNINLHDYILDVEDKKIYNLYHYKIHQNGVGKRLYSPIDYKSVHYEWYDLLDNKGVIFSEFDNHSIPRVKYASLKTTSLYYNSFLPLCELEFSQTKKNYTRNFKKLQNVFAEIGGIFSSLILIGSFLTNFINQISFKGDLINRLFINKNWENLEEELEISQANKLVKRFMEMSILNKNSKNMDKVNFKEKNKKELKSNNSFQFNRLDNKDGEYYLDGSFLKKCKKEGINNITNKNIDTISNDIINKENENARNNKNIEIKREIEDQKNEEKKNNIKIPSIDKEKTLNNIKKLLNNENEKCFFKVKFQDNIKENHFYFNIIDYLWAIFSCDKNSYIRKKKKYFEMAVKRIEQIFDTLYYCEMIEEQQVLKNIVFNKNQNTATQFLKRMKLKDYWKLNYEEEILECLEYFHNHKNDSLIDMQLRGRLNKTFCDLDYLLN